MAAGMGPTKHDDVGHRTGNDASCVSGGGHGHNPPSSIVAPPGRPEAHRAWPGSLIELTAQAHSVPSSYAQPTEADSGLTLFFSHWAFLTADLLQTDAVLVFGAGRECGGAKVMWAVPVTEAGMRHDPSVSEQKPAGADRAATAAAVPPLLPAAKSTSSSRWCMFCRWLQES